jgi:hypothetical protein
MWVQFMALIQKDCTISLDPEPWTLDLAPSSKVALREVFACLDVTTLFHSQTLGPSTWLVVLLEILQHGGVQGRESYVLGNP